MTDSEWFKLFDETKDKFQWFFKEYGFMKHWAKIIVARELGSRVNMMTQMNTVWYHLPDHIFNIRVNPKGWKEFLYLIEE